MIHRLGYAQCGIDIRQISNKPTIAILESWSDLTPCNATVPTISKDVALGVAEAGGVPVRIPTPGLGEQFIRPTTMLYRNLISMMVEELLVANPIDGVVSLSACDKTTAAALLGTVSADLPTVMLTTGPMANATGQGRAVHSGTDIWRMRERIDSGAGGTCGFSVEDMAVGPGHCNTMGTASTMAIAVEALGLGLAGESTTPAQSPSWARIGRLAGRQAVDAVRAERRPSRIVTESALRNGFIVLAACVGSTNAVLHLLSLAGRLGFNLRLHDLEDVFAEVPVLADISPFGTYTIPDFHDSGGVPTLLRALGDLLDLSCQDVRGHTLESVARSGSRPDGTVIRPLNEPVIDDPGVAIVTGNLAPDGALIKRAAASTELLVHRGPAMVFDSLEEYLDRYRDPDLPVSADTVLVVRNCGPVGYPGMPEVANLPIPPKLLERGIHDIVRISDGRMSGTSFGTVILHVAPEASVGGPLARLMTGDIVRLDVPRGELEVEADLESRSSELNSRVDTDYCGGYVYMFRESVLQANLGCDFGFLRGVRRRSGAPARSST